jgi:serine/threonine protein kinase/tetratricopeptide (TPR) repeat protein
MTPEDWSKAKELFDAALEQEPTQRAAFLAQACPDDNLRQEVEKLVINFQEAGSFLSNPVLHAQTPRPSAISEVRAENESPGSGAGSRQPSCTVQGTDDPMVGRHLGVYELGKRIGQGGMAAVFLAVRADGEYRQQVAIKLLLPGLDSHEVVSRLRTERQTLAGLDHPNIVKLLDGGSTPEGLPYLVMDYVEGSPIDEYCDSHKLSIEQRLRLFGKVCGAVQHAHERLIIHRDLKPGNILVTADGVPKLLDFGIAKVLEPTAAPPALTQTGARCMTPAYASPEQVRGKSVTAATDIYSLGVVLYELLSGHRPYRLKERTASDIERAICEQEPENPSTAVNRVESETSSDGTRVTKTPEVVSQTREGQPERLRRRLRGDLDNIVLKALAKEPGRRYSSVEEFGRDIDRHLRHLPVKARRSTLTYRASRLFKRHKIEASAASVFVLALAAAAWPIFQALGLRDRIPGSPSMRIRSLAVLPLANLSGDPTQEYFSDGLTDALITDLAQIGSLKVISLTSSMQYKQTKKPLPEIAHELNVDGIIEGTVQRSGDRIRIMAQLIHGLSEKHLWAQSYDGDMRDVFALERAVTEDIAHHVQQRLTRANSMSPIQLRPLDAKALELYLQGNYHLNKYGRGAGDEEKRTAAKFFQQVIDADPNFAPAYNGLANAHLSLLWPSNQDAEIAKEAAERAVALDPNLSDAHVTLASINFVSWNWQRTEEEHRRAIALNPNNAYAHDYFGYFLDDMGRMDEGWRESQIAQELDPSYDHISDALARRGRDDQAIALQKVMLRRTPDDAIERSLLFREYVRKGMYEEAIIELEQAAILFGFPQIAAASRRARAISGPRGAMRESLKGWELLWARHQAFLPVNFADLRVALGDTDGAFYWLEQAYAHHDIGIASTDVGLESLNNDFLLIPLRSDPRFKDLLRRIGLPEIPVGNSVASSQEAGHKE